METYEKILCVQSYVVKALKRRKYKVSGFGTQQLIVRRSKRVELVLVFSEDSVTLYDDDVNGVCVETFTINLDVDVLTFNKQCSKLIMWLKPFTTTPPNKG